MCHLHRQPIATTIVNMESDKPYVAPFIRRLMPNASEAEILEASETLRAYLMLLYGVFLRKEAEAQLADSRSDDLGARFGLDGDPPSTV